MPRKVALVNGRAAAARAAAAAAAAASLKKNAYPREESRPRRDEEEEEEEKDDSGGRESRGRRGGWWCCFCCCGCRCCFAKACRPLWTWVWHAISFGVILVAHLETARVNAPLLLDLCLERSRTVYLVATLFEVLLLVQEFVTRRPRWSPVQRTAAGVGVVLMIMMRDPLVMLHENWLTLLLVGASIVLHQHVTPWLRIHQHRMLARGADLVGRFGMAHYPHYALLVGLQGLDKVVQ